MTPDQRRLMEHAARPAIAELWKALKPLTSVVTVLQTGAHPDDETTQMLARLAFADGARVAYACAVRGEGGQNAVGTEARSVLGALRTGEMARAAETIDTALYWLNEAYDGPINDFGFSKSGPETLARWGHDRLVERLVRVIREERPDIVTPTFLDVPGQHGHHRAVTQATEEAFFKAADPAAYPEHFEDGLLPWAASKYYLPAWSGAGMAYDDDEPPPDATVTVDTGAFDPVLGATYAQIGQWSRAYHRSQGMGRWVEEGPASVALHRKHGPDAIPVEESHPFDGLPVRLRDLGRCVDDVTADALAQADRAVEAALAAFPDGGKVATALIGLIDAVDRALAAGGDTHARVGHRLTLKRRQAERALALALGLVVRLEGPGEPVAAGETAELRLSVYAGRPADMAVTEAALACPEGWPVETLETAPAGPVPAGQTWAIRFRLTIPADAAPTPVYRFRHDPLRPEEPVTGRICLSVAGCPVTLPVGASPSLSVVPPVSVVLAPDGAVWPTGRGAEPVTVTVTARNHGSQARQARISLPAPEGWAVTPPAVPVSLAPGASQPVVFELVPAGATTPTGRWDLAPDVTLDDTPRPGQQVRRIEHPHISALTMVTPARLPLLGLDVTCDRSVRVGVVEGGSDRVALWLERLGLSVTRLGPDDLATGDLDRFDTILVGIFAYGARPDLRGANDRLKAWVRQGGTLVTQYHRPWDAWDPDTTPPLWLEIGQPSLRWRVTDEGAAVTLLAPDHPLLTGPNRIGPGDWAGWVKERGLYFARSWDPAYVPLVRLADPGEAPLDGGLLSATVGRGRHTHCALVVHTQLEGLVPGGFRLLANLITPDGRR